LDHGLAVKRREILAAAQAGGVHVAVAMLDEALTQMEIMSPAVSAEVWDGYAAVRAARPTSAVNSVSTARD